ncbi:MAG: no significant likey [Firmicutes bacterium]|nr:no significant likey [Bacillota bacterium]
MGRRGFIQDKLDIKLLILFLMSRTATPINFATLTELTLCDDGFDYFEYAECLAELVSSEHLILRDGLYEITEKGRRNGGHGESSLPYSVRLKCEQNLDKLNPILRRNAQVRAEVLPREDGFFTLRLSLDDEGGNLLTLEMLTASTEQAAQLGKRFRAMPELVYNGILTLLTGGDGGRGQAKGES